MPRRFRDFEVYLVYIETGLCDGCGECARYCPCDVFDLFEKAYVSRPQNCLGCKTCEAVCKPKAVIITEI